MKLLCLLPQVQFMGYAPVSAPVCPMLMSCVVVMNVLPTVLINEEINGSDLLTRERLKGYI
jgi:hypothetical protein